MNRPKCFIIIVIASVFCLADIGFSFKVAVAASPKKMVVTTLDVAGSYEVIGIVTYRTNSTDINELINGLKSEASEAGAEAVIGVRCTGYGDFFYAYGTAVTFKKQ
jgi:hypothetical protein